MRKYYLLVFWLLSFTCFSQVLPSDKVYLLFDPSGPDSLCAYTSANSFTPITETIKKFRKEKVSEAGDIRFYICGEEFFHSAKRHTLDTLSGNPHFKYVSLETAQQIASRKISDYIEANKDSPELKILFNNDVLTTYIVEKINNNKFIRYETEWVEKVE